MGRAPQYELNEVLAVLHCGEFHAVPFPCICTSSGELMVYWFEIL